MPKTSSAMARSPDRPLLLIDTHIWLWLMEGHGSLAAEQREDINEAAAKGRLRLSAMSIWEIAMLTSRNRITLSRPVAAWIEASLVEPGPVLEPVSPEIALASCYLPGNFRSDPADEIIVATARVTGATLMTRDRRILDYAAAGHLNAIAA
jgi:PIN domain nuclease of toxin-antitoxin system